MKKVKNTTWSLVEFLSDSTHSMNRISYFLNALLSSFESYPSQERLCVSFLELFDLLLGYTHLIHEHDHDILSRILSCVQKIGYKSKDMRKLMGCLKVYAGICGLDSFPLLISFIKNANKKLVGYLSHPFPLVFFLHFIN